MRETFVSLIKKEITRPPPTHYEMLTSTVVQKIPYVWWAGEGKQADLCVCVCFTPTYMHACTCVCTGVDWTKQSRLADIKLAPKHNAQKSVQSGAAGTSGSHTEQPEPEGNADQQACSTAVPTRRQRTHSPRCAVVLRGRENRALEVGFHIPGRRLSLSNGERKAAKTREMTQECRAVTGAQKSGARWGQSLWTSLLG